MKGTQPFLCFINEGDIILEVFEAERIVNVRYLDVMVLQLFAEEDVLVTVVPETGVEGVGEHDGACYQEIGCVEVLVGMLAANSRQVGLFGILLIAIAERVAHGGCPVDDDTAVDDRLAGMLGIAPEEVVVGHHHVCIDKNKKGMAGLVGQEVADGSTAYVFFSFHIAAVGQ